MSTHLLTLTPKQGPRPPPPAGAAHGPAAGCARRTRFPGQAREGPRVRYPKGHGSRTRRATRTGSQIGSPFTGAPRTACVTGTLMAQPGGCDIVMALRAVAESFGPGRLMTVFLVAGAARAGVGGQAAVAARASRAWLVRRPVDMALNRLYTAAAKVHSAEALRLPRTDSWRKPMLCLMWPCGVSAMWPRWR